jgi:AcrR family transcriptional regulator
VPVHERILRGYTQVACSELGLDREASDKLMRAFIQALEQTTSTPGEQSKEFNTEYQAIPRMDLRVNASEGFMRMVERGWELTELEKEILRSLAHDSDRSVRWHVGLRIWSLWERWPDFVWETLERWADGLGQEPAAAGGLSSALRNSWFWWLRRVDEERANALLLKLDEAARAHRDSSLCKLCGKWFAAVWGLKGEAWARDELIPASAHVIGRIDELDGAVDLTTDWVFARSKTALDTDLLKRATELLVAVIEEVGHSLDDVMEDKPGPEGEERRRSSRFQPPRALAQFVALRFKLAAEENGQKFSADDGTGREAIAAWWQQVAPVLHGLIALPDTHTLYEVVDGIIELIQVDLGSALHWLRLATDAGIAHRFEFDPAAAELTLPILADLFDARRAELARSPGAFEDFVGILDTYLAALWAPGINLAIDLYTFFR